MCCAEATHVVSPGIVYMGRRRFSSWSKLLTPTSDINEVGYRVVRLRTIHWLVLGPCTLHALGMSLDS
jgi:hypothetical protein